VKEDLQKTGGKEWTWIQESLWEDRKQWI